MLGYNASVFALQAGGFLPEVVKTASYVGIGTALVAFGIAIILGYWFPVRYDRSIAPEYILLYVGCGIGTALLANPAWVEEATAMIGGRLSADNGLLLVLSIYASGFVVYVIVFAVGLYWIWDLYTPGGNSPPQPPSRE